jgi:hypothetical protein
MSETCPSCGGPTDDVSGRCQNCGQATTRRYYTGLTPKSNAPVPANVEIPCLVSDARFVVGETWTHGQIYLTDLGVYFLAAADGPWTPERLLQIAPPDPSKPRQVAPGSSYFPLNRIQRFQHTRLTSFAMFTNDAKLPLRLDHDGWSQVDGYAAKMGIPSS